MCAYIMHIYVQNSETVLILLRYVGGHFIYNIYIFKHSQIMSNHTTNKVACAWDSEDKSMGKDILLPRNVTKAVIYLWNFRGGKEEKTQRSQSCEWDKPYIIMYLANQNANCRQIERRGGNIWTISFKIMECFKPVWRVYRQRDFPYCSPSRNKSLLWATPENKIVPGYL